MVHLTGYRRENGRIGIRNYVAVIPLDDISNAAAEGVSYLIRDVIALSHPYGRLQFGEDLELTFDTLIGTGRNPNIAAAIVIGIEPEWTNVVVEGIAETGKPVSGFSIERRGDIKTIELATRQALEYVQRTSEIPRESVKLEELMVSAKCGESDTTLGLASNPAIGRVLEQIIQAGGTAIFGETSEITGAESLVAAQAVNQDVATTFLNTFNAYQEFIIGTGADLLGSQPTKGNIRGGLSTIEEKAFGNIQKMGRNKMVSVLQPAEAPKTSGLHFMDSSSAAAEMVTLCAAAGSVLHFFTTGQGNIIGHPIIPVMKICANPLTVSTMAEHIDVDLSAMLSLELSVDEAAETIIQMMTRTVNGRLTAAEALRHNEFVLTKLYRSA
ncbi:MAG: UxaA family hydrolase [Candidatus Bathyarchaeota archaeon]|nr:UxaA family hydrolase [Candidatus Bathyarchaeota archaeon]